MGKFIKGDVVVIPFPFSDLSSSKRRPAVVVADLKGNDVILCQITSQSKGDPYSLPITGLDFNCGGLHRGSFVRPSRIFTADSNIIQKKAGALTGEKTQEVVNKIIEIITA